MSRPPLTVSTEDEELIADHLTFLRRKNARPATMTHRRGQLRRLAQFLLLKYGLGLLSADVRQIDAWQASLDVSPSAVYTYSSHVRAFYRWAIERSLVDVDPCRLLPVPKLPERVPRPIDEAHLRVALEAARETPHLRVWMLLAAYSGLRAGEVAAIEGRDLRESDGGASLLVHGKGGHERTVRVPAPVLRELRDVASNTTGPIFTVPGTRRRLTGHDVSVTAARYLRGLGLPYTFHQLRHRFATVLCDQGADVRDVQAFLGHKSLATTTRYVAYNARRGSQAVDRMGAELDELRNNPDGTLVGASTFSALEGGE